MSVSKIYKYNLEFPYERYLSFCILWTEFIKNLVSQKSWCWLKVFEVIGAALTNMKK